MPNQVKQQKVNDFNQKIEKAKAIFLTDYKGLSVNKIQELRRKLNATKAEFEVTKNTLLSIALKNKGITTPQPLTGPTATLFAYQDEITPLKELVNFAKENEDLPQLKIGFLGKDCLTDNELKRLATLPNKETLLTQLIITWQSPMSKFLYNLNYHAISFINLLNNLKEEKTKEKH